MNDDLAAPAPKSSGAPVTRPVGRSRGGLRPRGPAKWTWPVLFPLLGIPALVIASFVSSSNQSPPDFCGQHLGPTCQQVDGEITAIRLAAWGSLALALALWLAAFLPPGRRMRLGGRALLVLAGNGAILCAGLLGLRVGF